MGSVKLESGYDAEATQLQVPRDAALVADGPLAAGRLPLSGKTQL